MGDLIQALSAFGRIRARYPRARLGLLTGEQFGDMTRGWGLFDDVITLDLANAYHGSARARVALLARLRRTLREWRPDVVGLLKGAPQYAVLAWLSGADTRVGLTRGIGRLLLTTPIVAHQREHREDRYLRVAAALDAHGVEGTVVARWTPGRAASQLLPAKASCLIGLMPGGGNAKQGLGARQWPLRRYAELASCLAQQIPGVHFVIIGGPADRLLSQALLDQVPTDSVTDLAGKTTPEDARVVIAACNVVVVNDSGLLHLAATTTTSIVAIFGPTAPMEVAPRHPRLDAVWHPARPYPCYDTRTGRMQRCVNPCCIERCSVDEVAARVLGQIRSFHSSLGRDDQSSACLISSV